MREGPQFHPMVRTLLLSVCPSPELRLLTFSDQKILGRIPRYSLALRCYSVMNEITATRDQRVTALRLRQSPPDLLRRVQGGVHHRRGGIGRRARRASGALASALIGCTCRTCVAPHCQRGACNSAYVHVWCTARFATPPTCGPVSGVNTDNERSLWTNSDCMYVLQ